MKSSAGDKLWPAQAALAGRLILGAVFLLSGYLKLVSPLEEFMAAIETFKLLPSVLIPPFATALPWLELILGAFLFLGYLTRVSLLGIAGMLCVFTGAISLSILRGLNLTSCGCFASIVSLTPYQDLALDCVLLAISLGVWVWERGLLSLDDCLQN